MTKTGEYQTMTVPELREKLEDLREGLYRLRHRRAVEEDVAPNRIREHRKQIARVLTVLRQRELAATEGGAKDE